MNETWQDIDSKNPSTSVKRSLNKLGANFGTEIQPESSLSENDQAVLLQRIDTALQQLENQPELSAQFQNLKDKVLASQLSGLEAHEMFFALSAQGSTQQSQEQKEPQPFVTRFFNALRHTFSRQ